MPGIVLRPVAMLDVQLDSNFDYLLPGNLIIVRHGVGVLAHSHKKLLAPDGHSRSVGWNEGLSTQNLGDGFWLKSCTVQSDATDCLRNIWILHESILKDHVVDAFFLFSDFNSFILRNTRSLFCNDRQN